MHKNGINKLLVVIFVAVFSLTGCKTAQKPNNIVNSGLSKTYITNSKKMEITTYPLPQKPELRVISINGNEVLAQSIEPFKSETVLYSSSNLKDYTVINKIPESKGYYYSDPNGKKRLYFISYASKGQTGLWKGEVGGENWRRLFKEPVKFLTFHPTQKAKIYIVNETPKTSAKIYTSEDYGETWEKCSEITGAYLVNQIAINPQNPQYMLAAARNGLWVTFDNGEHWTNLFAKAEPTNIIYNPINPREAYFIGHGKVYQLFDNKIKEVEYGGDYGVVSSLVFKPNSNTACFLSENQEINIFKVENGKAEMLTTINKSSVGVLYNLLFDSTNCKTLYGIGYKHLVKMVLGN